jgi:hypothetical protein
MHTALDWLTGSVLTDLRWIRVTQAAKLSGSMALANPSLSVRPNHRLRSGASYLHVSGKADFLAGGPAVAACIHSEGS